jgi:hypothetical protein
MLQWQTLPVSFELPVIVIPWGVFGRQESGFIGTGFYFWVSIYIFLALS